MRNTCIPILFLFLTCCFEGAIAQSTDRLSYQAVVRSASGAILASQSIGMRISILKGTATGTVVYSETHARTTNAQGLVNLEIGGGSAVSGNFSTILWSQGPYFIKIETDVSGGTNYQLTFTTQLLSVPYSLYAQSAALKFSASGDTLFSGREYVIVPGLSSANTNAVVTGSPSVITGVANAVTTVSASLGGEVISAGASAVSARGICYGTSASPTVANNTVASGSGLGTFTVTIPGLNPATTYYARAYAVNGNGTTYGNQVFFTTLGATGQACAQGSTLTVTHTAGDVAPVTKTVTYKLIQTDLSGASKCWIAQNLGADRQAVSYDDNSEESAGWYWQYNRKRGFRHDGMVTRTPNTQWISSINEDMSWSQSNDPCFLLLGAGWRLPVNVEWINVYNRGNFSLSNAPNYFYSILRLHHSGHINYNDGVIVTRGTSGNFWSMNQSTLDRAYNFYISLGGSGLSGTTEKPYGFPIRCIKD
jgi:uncharacterized protein (TIGR02145 family)